MLVGNFNYIYLYYEELSTEILILRHEDVNLVLLLDHQKI